MCFISIDTRFDHLINVLSASLLHCKITVPVPFVINRYFVERVFETLSIFIDVLTYIIIGSWFPNSVSGL